MSLRVNYNQQAPELVQKLAEMGQVIKKGSLGVTMIDLVNIRASLLNGCAFCIDMHVKEARIHGERDLRVLHVPIWRESSLFTDKEKAALEWTEAVTKLTEHGIPDEIYQRVREQLSEKELTELTFAIGVINAWNRLSIGFKAVPGSADKFYGLDKAGLS
jgi:AhpD family alkylhydroperoxidase